MFGFAWTRYRLSILARSLVLLAALAGLSIWYWWPNSRDLLQGYESVLKLVGYVVGPLLALFGFFATRLGEMELRDQAKEIGQLAQIAKQAEWKAADEARQVELARKKLADGERQILALQDDLERITRGSDELWKIRPARPYGEYLSGMRSPRGAKIVTVGNLKGGVGKTTIAANLAAYISETKKRPVLLIDLDFQASLSNMMLLSIEREETPETVLPLLADNADLGSFVMNTVHLTPKLSQGWLVPAGYDLAKRENQMLLEELTQKAFDIDIRYRLANVLLRAEVRERYDAIIIDMPPRMSVASVNALVASHFLLVPTVLDRISTEAISQFLSMMRGIKSDLHLDLDVLGVVANMTRMPISIEKTADGELQINQATRKEHAELIRVVEAIDAGWPGASIVGMSLPRRSNVSGVAGEDVAYVQNTAQDRQKVHEIFDPIGAEICHRMGI